MLQEMVAGGIKYAFSDYVKIGERISSNPIKNSWTTMETDCVIRGWARLSNTAAGSGQISIRIREPEQKSGYTEFCKSDSDSVPANEYLYLYLMGGSGTRWGCFIPAGWKVLVYYSSGGSGTTTFESSIYCYEVGEE